jgi:hypothetical protein
MVSNRLLILIKGTYDLMKQEFTGVWEQIATPFLTFSVTQLYFSEAGNSSDAIQSYTVSGKSMQGSIDIWAPEGFEISLDGSTWDDNLSVDPESSSSLVINDTTIYVRMIDDSTGYYVGEIKHTSDEMRPRYVYLN